MALIKLDDKCYEVPDPVIKRMGEYYDTMKKTITDLETLKALTQNVRNAQKEYFATRDKAMLAKSKHLESELDFLLSGKKKPQEQPELFR